ncbi:MAG: hypothetical protein AB7H81_08035 [Vicinamibacterales bacterium]
MSPISEVTAALPAFLQAQRWFGGKSRALAGVTLLDHVWLQEAATPDFLAFIEVAYTDAPAEQYCLWLGIRDTADGTPVAGQTATGRLFVDVSTNPGSASILLRRLAARVDVPTAEGGALRFGDVTAHAVEILREPPETRAVGADQSNTSLAIGRALVFKLFRRIQPGENPEVEVCRFLTNWTSFRGFAPLHGSVAYARPDGTTCAIGVLQAFVQNSGDGWQYVQRRLLGELDRPGSWDTRRDDLLALGAITAGFHRASASDSTVPAFAPAPIAAQDIIGWVAAVRDHAATAVGRIRDARLTNDEAARLARALTRVAATDAPLLPVATGPGATLHAIRIHGDYHLGQTLKTPSGFILIDFEGEPARPIEDRRRKQCALKDVAGMLRSFEYALAAACEGAPDRVDAMRDSLSMAPVFLEGYFSTPGMEGSVFLPSDPAARLQWLRFFELEKALYELDYELNNRPDWAHIPARGLMRILDA